MLFVKELRLHIWYNREDGSEDCIHTTYKTEDGKRGIVDWCEINRKYGDAEVLQIQSVKQNVIEIIADRFGK